MSEKNKTTEQEVLGQIIFIPYVATVETKQRKEWPKYIKFVDAVVCSFTV